MKLACDLVLISCILVLSVSAEPKKKDGEKASCSRGYVAGKLGMCTRKLTKSTLKAHRGSVCRLQQNFLWCMEKLTQKCNISPRYETNLVAPIRQTYQENCDQDNVWIGSKYE